MRNMILSFTALLTLGIMTSQPASAATNAPVFMGIDSSVVPSGVVSVAYNGIVYHLTEDDTLAGETVLLIDKTDNQVIVKNQDGSETAYRFN